MGAVDRLAEEERFRRRKEVVREERESHRLSRGMDIWTGLKESEKVGEKIIERGEGC